ncbi:hypothetical protein [Halorubrum sp. SD626R]|uniref:hypothetical protein n=1 Tax=Halorubrum sp. SD626R TaxID=1419722 RepID=UPI000A74ECF6|nr:hypothetical protein [Halorubrum sp. SD626R]TKX80267.1 hypothetical protein EXE53_11860 [Halorubrum sp. SD626R]
MNNNSNDDSEETTDLTGKYGENVLNPERFIQQSETKIQELTNKKEELERQLNENPDDDDLKSEVETAIRQMDQLLEEREQAITERNKESRSLREQTEELKEEYQSELGKIKEKRKNAEEIEERLSNLEDTASDLLDRTTSSALGEQFAERKKELETPLRGWKIASALSIFLLLGASWIIYTDIGSSTGGITSNITKIGLLLPISVAVWFCVSNYTRQKRLIEEYEFKARMAISLVGFREALDNELDGNSDELIAEFMINTMENIYTNPQDNINSDEENPDPQSTQTALLELIRNS